MRDENYYRQQIEATVKRLKKSELADHFARQLARLDAEAQREHDRRVNAEQALKPLELRLERLESIERAVALVLLSRVKKKVSPEQLALRFGDDGFEDPNEEVLDVDASEAEREDATIIADTIEVIVDRCSEIAGDIERRGFDVDKLDTALCDALTDREALLKRLGLTDREWSAMGGACEADFEV